MDEIKEFDADDGTQFIKVSLYDTKFSSTVLKANADTTTACLIEAINNKIEIAVEDRKYFNLVLVVTGQSDYSDRSTRHCLRTLKTTENVLDIESQLRKRQTLRHRFHSCCSRWYFKDMRTSPLELGDACDLTGDCSSDEDEEISLNDLSCITSAASAAQSGYMLKRSSKDPHVWQQRYCVLTDKLWCVNDRLRVPTASCISINSSTKLHTKCSILDCPGAIIMQSNQGSHAFIVTSLNDQQNWISELSMKASYMSDNDVINMAEIIICDEVGTRCQRVERGLSPLLDTYAMKEYLNPHYRRNSEEKVHDCRKNGETKNGDMKNGDMKNGEVRNGDMKNGEMKNCGDTINGHHSSLHSSDTSHPLANHDYPPQHKRFGNHHNNHRRSIRHLQQNNSHIYEALSFINSINAYQDLFRHDLGVTAEMQWKAVLQIFHQNLSPLFANIGLQMDSSDILSEKNSEIFGTRTYKNLDSIDNYINGENQSYFNHISIDTIIRLHTEIFSNIIKCDRKINSTSSEKIPLDSKVFPKTPSAGGEDNSMRILFGEGLTSSALSISPVLLSSTGTSLWSWTSRALGLGENVIETDTEETETTKYDGIIGQNNEFSHRLKRGKSSDGVSPLKSVSTDEFSVSTADKSTGAFIHVTVSSSQDSKIASIIQTYYLKDRYVRPDSSIFHELSEKLNDAMS